MAVVESGAPVLATTAATAQIVDTALFAAIATTSSTTTTAGSSQTITVSSGTGIVVGMWLTIDTGAALETVQVTAVAGTSVTAIFANVHTGTYAVVANINRQIVSVGSPSVQGRIAEVDATNRLNTITPDIVVTGQTLSLSATTNNNVIANSSAFSSMSIAVTTNGTAGTIVIEGTIDGIRWITLPWFGGGNFGSTTSWSFTSIPANTTATYIATISGMQSIRIRCSITNGTPFSYAYVLTNASTNQYMLNVNPLSISSVNVQEIGGTSISGTTFAGNVDGQIISAGYYLFIAMNLVYNGSSWDRPRKDTYAAGPQWVTTGGGSTKVVAAAAGTTVVKASAGRLCKVLVTGGTITTALTFYDNATATTGNVVGIIPATAAVTGIPFVFDWPCANGITGDFLAGSPAVSIAYW